MGKQPEPDAPTEEPVDELDECIQDVEIVATLDLSLDFDPSGESGDPENAFDPDATPLAMCQICMEFYGSQEVVRSVCGTQCLAEICPDCLVQHLTATVYSFYPGVLPKMRCPVCLVVLNKSQWKKFVVAETVTTEEEEDREEEEEEEKEADEPEAIGEEEPAEEEDEDAEEEEEEEEEEEQQQQQQQVEEWGIDHSHVLDKFEVLCRQSCGFQSPCCHNTEYSMLWSVRESRVVKSQELRLPTSQASQLSELSRLYREYAFHRVEASELYDFVNDKFGANADDLLEMMLANMADDERRANLLLLQLFHNPNTYTSCCNHAVCFKCKAAHHHDGKCNDFVVDENVLDCPGCRVTLVKVDGCDSVTCLCGYAIEWPHEMQKQRLQRRQLVPVDNREYGWWNRWTRRFDPCRSEIGEVVALLRQQRLQRMLFQHRDALQLFVDRAVRRARLNILIREQRERLRVVVRRHLERRKGSAMNDHVATSLRIAPAA